METRISGEFARRRVSYNVYSAFVRKNHKMLWLRILRNPYVLIAFLLFVFSVVGSIDHAAALAGAAQ